MSLGDVTAGPDGKVVHEARRDARASPVVGTGFSLDVTPAPSATPGATVACGDLSRLRHAQARRHK